MEERAIYQVTCKRMSMEEKCNVSKKGKDKNSRTRKIQATEKKWKKKSIWHEEREQNKIEQIALWQKSRKKNLFWDRNFYNVISIALSILTNL